MSSIADLFGVLNSNKGELYCKVCKVDVVDEDKRVCDVSPIDGSAPLLDVKLQANQDSKHGVVVFPKKDSYVVVGFLTPDVGVVLMTDEIDKVDVAIGKTTIFADKDKIVFNGGENQGLIKIKELTKKLNGLKDTVDVLVNNFNAHTHTYENINTSVTTSPTLNTAQAPQPFNESDYENDKIMH